MATRSYKEKKVSIKGSQGEIDDSGAGIDGH